MIKKGVKTARFNSAESKRLWLSLILSVICAALVCCAFIVPKIGKNEINSKAYTTEAQSTFSQVEDENGYVQGYLNQGSKYNAVSYATLHAGTASTSVISRSFTGGEGTCVAYMKKAQSTSAVKGYMAFKAEIEVPASTEYKVTYNFAHNYQRLRKGSTGGTTGSEFFYYGDSEHGGSDLSSTMTFQYNTTSSTDYSKSYYGTKVGAVNLTNYVTIEITYTNNTNDPLPCTAYFGLYAHSTDVSASGSNLGVVGQVTLTEETVEATDTTVTTDKEEATYNENGNNFIFDYDQDIIDLSYISYTDMKGNVSDVTGDYSIDTDGNCKLYDAGTYTFGFDLDPTCIYVWEDSGDKTTTYEVTVKINPKELTVSWSGETYDNGETGSDSLFFILPTPTISLDAQKYLTGVQYYLKTDYNAATGAVTGSAVDLTDIVKNNDYYAVVLLKNEYSSDNFTFSDKAYSLFTPGDDRTIIVVTLKNSGETYDGNSHAAEIEVVDENNVTLTEGVDIFFEYTYQLDGDPVYDGGSGTAPINAGTYKLTLKIKSDYDADYKPNDKLEFDFAIDKADPVVDPKLASEDDIYAGGEFPELVQKAGGTEGTFTWVEGQKLTSGTKNYSYIFTPTGDEAGNYKEKRDIFPLTTTDAKMKEISATLTLPTDDEGNVTVTIYDTWDLKNFKQYLTVSGEYNSGKTVEKLNDTDYELTGTLIAGDGNTITVTYKNSDTEKVTCTFTVDGVVESVFEGIEAVFSQDGTVYTSAKLDDLKEMLTVTSKYNDPTNKDVIAADEYELSLAEGTELKDGVNEITVTYTYKDTDYTTTFKVKADLVELKSLTADFHPGDIEIKCTTPLNNLKDWLTVKGVNNDGSDYGVITDYTLEGTLSNGGTSQITVKYKGKSVKFDVTTVYLENGGVKTALPVPEIKEITYSGSEIDLLSGWGYTEFVTVSGNKGTAVGPYTLTIKINDFEKYEWNVSNLKELTKRAVKYGLTTEYEGYTIEGDTLTAQWEIAPAVLKASWNKNGKLDLSSPSYTGSWDGLVSYKYFDKDGNEVTDLKGGESYAVVATLEDTNNFVLDGDTVAVFEQPHTFTAPESGAMKVINTIKEFLMGKWMGMPVWAWLLIGLALLILLIIIIAVACKRRKSKEEKAEAKARKEEERERREEERRLQKERLEAERELEKMRAQAQMAAGMGMASMAMPQQMPQMQQPQIQQARDDSAMRRMEAELADLRTKLAAQQSAPAAMPQPPYPSQQGDMNAVMFAKIEAELAALRANQQMQQQPQYFQQPMQMPVQQNDANAAVMLAKMEAEFAKMQLEFLKMHGTPMNFASQIPAPQVQMLPQNVQEVSQPIQTQYPSDAVVTTTTTVDTTQKPSPRRSERGSRDDFADVDGFYDSID